MVHFRFLPLNLRLRLLSYCDLKKHLSHQVNFKRHIILFKVQQQFEAKVRILARRYT